MFGSFQVLVFFLFVCLFCLFFFNLQCVCFFILCVPLLLYWLLLLFCLLLLLNGLILTYTMGLKVTNLFPFKSIEKHSACSDNDPWYVDATNVGVKCTESDCSSYVTPYGTFHSMTECLDSPKIPSQKGYL